MSKEILKKMSNDLGIPESKIDFVITNYWKGVKKLLVKADRPNILLNGFGTFEVKEYLLNSMLQRYIKILRIERTEKYIAKFRTVWKLRQKLK